MTSLESAEEFHARVAAVTDDEGRPPVAIELMPGWDIFPFELDGLRIKPLDPLADEEPPRRGEDPSDCLWRLELLDMRLPIGRCHMGRDSTLLDWEENLPPVPEDVRRANAAHVADLLLARFGGDGPACDA